MQVRSLSRVLVVALVAGVLQLMGQSSTALAAPAAPGGLTPSNISTSGQPVLQWSRVSGAAKYEVQLSTDSGFSPLTYSVTTTNSRATPTANLPQTEIFWRVRGVTSTGVNGSWASTSFTGSSILGPALVSPLEGSALQEPEDPALLTWTPVVKAISYTIEIDDDDSFVQSTSYTSKTTAYLFSAFDPGIAYSWHVKANFAGGFNSQWSEVQHFSVKGLRTPMLTSPNNSPSTPVADAVLDWRPVAGAVKYELRVSTDDQFNTIVDTATVYSTSYARPATLNNDQYWWQVRAVDVNGKKSDWADYFQFQRSWSDQPTLVYPAANASVANPFYYQWSPIPHASQYELQVSTDSNFSPGLYDRCLTKATTYTTRFGTDTCHPVAGRLIYWRVRGLDLPTGVNGIFSEIHSFIYNPAQVQQLAPTSGATVDVPKLSWEPYPEAEKYKVVITKSSGSAITETTYSTSWTPTGTLRLKASDGPFTWTVQAIGHDGALTQIPVFGVWNFQVTEAVPDDLATSALTPTGPINGAHSARFPSLTWEPYVDDTGPATTYKVYVSQEGTNSYLPLPDSFPYSAATDDTDDWLAPGAYEWFVVAYRNSSQVAGPGPTRTFVVDDLAGVSGQALSLTGQGFTQVSSTCVRYLANPTPEQQICQNLQQTPVLKWDSVPGAASYMVYVSRDKELTNLVYNPESGTSGYDPEAVTSNTMWTPQELLPDSQAGTAYYWVIRPCKATGVCAPDPTTAANAFDKRSNPIAGLVERQHDSGLVLPEAGAQFANEVAFSWDDYLTTNQVGNDRDDTHLPSTVESKTYRVQISTDPNFPVGTATIVSPELDQTSYSIFSRTLPEGPLYWRVQAIDGSANALAWSLTKKLNDQARSITKQSPPPTVLSPDAVTGSGNPSFTWQPQEYAAKYTIEVYKNNDTTFSTANRVANATTTQPGYALTDTVLPPAGSPYIWRVRRIDAYNLTGGWSQTASFVVTGNPPTQVLPASAAYVSNRDAYFSWLPVDGAATYRFESRRAGSTSASSTTTVGLSWAPTSILTDGGYEWRASAYDAGNNPLGASVWRTFKVDSITPTLVSKSPTTTATGTANFVAKFSEPMLNINTTTMALFVKGQQHQLSAAVTLSNGNKTATLNPAVNLKPGKIYTVRLLKGITDRASNPLKAQSWTVTAK